MWLNRLKTWTCCALGREQGSRWLTEKTLFTRGHMYGYRGLHPSEPLRGSTFSLMPPPPLTMEAGSMSVVLSNSTYVSEPGQRRLF